MQVVSKNKEEGVNIWVQITSSQSGKIASQKEICYLYQFVREKIESY
jgi:hypothetical protein